ncbi:hypothetical protein PYW08_009006 [Mythimna loreyi]|uniref:Uncharacterized protein n=1 Tax=Mythimna loreyi TaxID=667449 RepID=A0ACC2QA02_9NEOP|nr:hypothetical protein PYW08_009006 [Mythimna loreyi]
MARLVSLFSALWLSSILHFGSTLVTTGINSGDTNELQARPDPHVKSLGFIGGSLCATVKPLLGVSYDDFEDNEPDMRNLTLVYMTSTNETLTYNLTEAPTALPKEEWFNPKCGILVFLHGFTDSPEESKFQTIRLAVEEGLGDCLSILALDSSSLIQHFYLRASTIVTFIGRVLGETLAALIPAGLKPSNIHLIGHSLGAHIAGSAGKEVFKTTGRKIGRITGLDPAGPCFSNVNTTLRLFKGDADFVDVIHSNAGVYGLDETIGHVDFWVNGGCEQPGCLLQTCSHSRSLEYFAESMLSPDAFIGVKCNNYYSFRRGKCDRNDMSIMGYYTPASVTGDYYLYTAAESPYGTGALGTTYDDNGFLKGIALAIKDTFYNVWHKIKNRFNG